MCMVSNVFDYGRTIWPTHYTVTGPNATYTQPFPDTKEWEAFKELLEKAKQFDEIAHQPDCEDPEKVKWMTEMEERMAALENRTKLMVTVDLFDNTGRHVTQVEIPADLPNKKFIQWNDRYFYEGSTFNGITCYVEVDFDDIYIVE